MNDRADAGAARETTYPDASPTSVGEGAVSRQTQGTEAGQVVVSTPRRGVRGRP